VESPLVSAIMPVYNGERFLEQALDSLLAQDHVPLEIVVCDDGSTDRTPAILRSYPIRVVRQENHGAGAARNSAIAASSGEFVAFFDADDLWPPNRVSVQLRHLLANPDVGCVLGRQEWIDPPPWLTRDATYGDLGGIPLLSAMIRRGVFDDLGGFDPSFRVAEDTDLLIRMRERGTEIAVLPVVILTRRFHGGNLTADLHQPPAQVVRALRQKLARARLAPPESLSGCDPDPQ
jgi:glycosyltransferase involved in cell wall biosynthesis